MTVQNNQTSFTQFTLVFCCTGFFSGHWQTESFSLLLLQVWVKCVRLTVCHVKVGHTSTHDRHSENMLPKNNFTGKKFKRSHCVHSNNSTVIPLVLERTFDIAGSSYVCTICQAINSFKIVKSYMEIRGHSEIRSHSLTGTSKVKAKPGNLVVNSLN